MPSEVQYVLKKILGNVGDRYPEYAEMIWDWLETQPQCKNCIHWTKPFENNYGYRANYGQCQTISLAGESDTHLPIYIFVSDFYEHPQIMTKESFSCASFQKERNESGR